MGTRKGKAEILKQLAELIGRLSGRVRIAVDGRTASGKTTFADTLAGEIGRTGREVIRTSIDGFHRSKAERYTRGRYSAEGYYFDARDLDAVRTLLLDPLGPGGNGQYRTASFDLEHDQPIEQATVSAAADCIRLLMERSCSALSYPKAGMSRFLSMRQRSALRRAASHGMRSDWAALTLRGNSMATDTDRPSPSMKPCAIRR